MKLTTSDNYVTINETSTCVDVPEIAVNLLYKKFILQSALVTCNFTQYQQEN